jgi:hypothetical protein
MNREFEKLLKEKWFLVAADLIAVMAILLVMPDKRDGFDTFLVICAILAASLIVVIPVLKDGGGKAERQAEQARLRAKLAEEIDLQRDNIRAGNEAMNRRIAEAETAARKVAEASAAAVAQRASAEINALKAALAELGAKVAAGSSDAVDELTAKLEDLAGTVRGLVADADEAAENAGMLRLGVAGVQALESEVKSVREELKKSVKAADKATDKLAAALDSLREEVAELRSRPSAPAAEDEEAEEVEVAPVAAAPEPVAAAAAAEEAPAEEEASEEEEVIEEIEDAPEEEAVPTADEAAPSGTGTALIVNLMIGIGNKPFVRGTGPGLSRDKGVPMSFLGIGRWQWVSPDPEAPATVEVWKNDQSPMGEALHLPGGEPVEVDEGHFGGV